MATVNKDFKIKSGLIVEGLQGTINNKRILTEDAGDQYILDLIGGETLVKSVSNQFDVSAGGELSLDRAVVDAYYDAAGSASAAQAAAEATASADATSKANAAQAAAELTASGDATNKANQALTDAQNYADAQIQDAQTTSTTTWSSYKTSTEIGLAEERAKDHADDAVAALVGSAPELLDTLQELAAALDNDPDAINSLQSIAAGKQDELTAGANIDITGATISVTGLDTDDVAEGSNLYFTNQRALDATSAAYDAAGSASAAQAAAIAHADALTTSDIAEGTNEYFTDYRAKVSAVDLLTNASKSNIEITWTNQGGLVIAAENGVAGSTTTDLAEGTNLYFTDERAVDALEAVVPNFTAVEVNSVAKQVASTMSAASAGAHVGHAFAKADYRSAEFLVKVAYGTHTEISKVLLTLDSSDNISMTEYGIVGTNGSASSVSANVDGANVQLLVTTTNNNSTVTVVGTLLA